MDQLVVDEPAHASRQPLDGVTMEVLGSIEPHVEEDGGATMAIVQCGTFVAGIVIDIDEQPSCVLAEKLDVDLLAREVAVEEEAGHEARALCWFELGFETAVAEACQRMD